MHNQIDVIKKAAALIEEKKYIKAKDILNNFIKKNKRISKCKKIFREMSKNK